jgi:hypothetical protein
MTQRCRNDDAQRRNNALSRSAQKITPATDITPK